jgi:zinc transport system substrate-binding protein
MREPRAIATTVRAILATATLAAALAAAGACAATPGPTSVSARVVASFYPLQFVAEQVGGARVSVTTLSQPGAEPHDLELGPRQVADVAEADLVVYLSGFQPAVDEALHNADAPSLDAATAVPLLNAATTGTDPHFWLDPTRLATRARAGAERLGVNDKAGAAGHRERARELSERLDQLDRDYTEGLRTCQAREIVTSHTAFGYLAERYQLEQIGITGLSPETEPTPRRLAEVAETARRTGATTIFFETLVSEKVAETIATEVGASTAVLDPIEGLARGATGDYFSVMRANLSTLRAALGCTP